MRYREKPLKFLRVSTIITDPSIVGIAPASSISRQKPSLIEAEKAGRARADGAKSLPSFLALPF